MNSLRSLGLIGNDLMHTVNGREFVTRDKLCSEVQEALDAAGGRLSLVDLPSILNVDLSHCNRAAEEAADKEQSGITQHQGELFSEAYIDGIADEIGELLAEGGIATIGDLARQFSLGADILTTFLRPRLSTIINGQMDGGVLYTDGYINRLRAQVRGALRGCDAPIPLTTLTKELGLVTSSSSLSAVVQSTIEEIGTNELGLGKLTAGSWVPYSYVSSQQDYVKQYYSQNNYITYEAVTKCGVPQGRQFLTHSFPEGIAMGTIFISPVILQQLELAIEEALSCQEWCDVMSALPSDFSETDAAALLEQVKGSFSIFAGTVAVAPAFVDSLQNSLIEIAKKEAEMSSSRKEADKKGASAAPTIVLQSGRNDDTDEEDWSNKGKGKGRKKAMLKKKGSATTATKSQPSREKSSAEERPEFLTQQGLEKVILKSYPDLEGVGTEGTLPSSLASHVSPAVTREYQAALHAIFTAGAGNRKRLRDAASASLESNYQKLQLFARGAQLYEDDVDLHASIMKHLMKSIGGECMEAVMKSLAADSSVCEDMAIDETVALTAQQRAAIIADVPADLKSTLVRMQEAQNNSLYDSFVDALEAATESAGLWLRKLDKKAEKQAVLMFRKTLEEQLEAECTASAGLTLLVPLLIASHTGKAVILPGRALGLVLEKLKRILPKEQYEVLTEYHRATVEYLKGTGSNDVCRLEELLTKAKTLVLRNQEQASS